MALAYLCRQLELTPIGGPISVTAFVVDHRARPESADEAKTVSTWLSNMGMYPIIKKSGYEMRNIRLVIVNNFMLIPCRYQDPGFEIRLVSFFKGSGKFYSKPCKHINAKCL